jgi:hypothetical protein
LPDFALTAAERIGQSGDTQLRGQAEEVES